MTKYALAASLFAAFIAGCSTETSDRAGSSEDAVVGGESGKTFDFDDGLEEEEALPPLEGDGTQGTVKPKDVMQSSKIVNVKPIFDVPRPGFAD